MMPILIAAADFQPRALLPNEWLMVILYVAGVLYWGFRFRGQASQSPAESFLAGRSVPGWIASCSTVASNLNANDFIGWAGAVYLIGVVMVHLPLHTAIVICFLGLVVVRKLRHLIVGTNNGGPDTGHAANDMTLYIDGAPVGVQIAGDNLNGANTVHNLSALNIGSRETGSVATDNSLLDEAAIWSRPR